MIENLLDEVLEMDEINKGGVSLSNLFLDDFRMDLLNFMETNCKELEAAPLGIYALVPHKLKSILFKPDSLIID